jgi:sulfur transfer protein SufE
VGDDRSQSRADGLAALVEGLAAALHAAGTREETAARLLSKASVAVLQALTLELLLEPPRAAAAAPERVAEPQRAVEPDFRLAA